MKQRLFHLPLSHRYVSIQRRGAAPRYRLRRSGDDFRCDIGLVQVSSGVAPQVSVGRLFSVSGPRKRAAEMCNRMMRGRRD